jgi:hypothetical protein
MSQEERSIFWELIVSAIPSKKVYMNMYLIPNDFGDRVISLYSSKIADNAAYFLHERTAEPQKQPLLRNTRMQQ